MALISSAEGMFPPATGTRTAATVTLTPIVAVRNGYQPVGGGLRPEAIVVRRYNPDTSAWEPVPQAPPP